MIWFTPVSGMELNVKKGVLQMRVRASYFMSIEDYGRNKVKSPGENARLNKCCSLCVVVWARPATRPRLQQDKDK